MLPVQFGFAQRDYVPQAIAQYRATGQAFDAICGAPYFDLPGWGAQMTGWTPAQVLDVMRAYLALDPQPRGWYADFGKAVSQYEAAIGRRVLRCAYEGGLQKIAPKVVSPWDWASHSDVGDTERVLWSMAQAAGFDLFTYFNFLDVPRIDGSNWGIWTSQGQLWGAGDGSDGRITNRFVGLPTNTAGAATTIPATGNVSARGQAWRDWQLNYWLTR